MLPPIEETIDIEASRERVWEVISTPELVGEWLGCMQFEARVGALFYMQPDAAKRAAGDTSGATHCEVIDLDEPETFRFSWFMPGTPKTHVTIALEEAAKERTRVTLIHDGWDQFEPEEIRGLRDMLAGGWKSFVLPGLRQVAERGR